MESQPAAKYAAPSTKLRLCSGSGSTSQQDPDVMEVSASGIWVSNNQQKRKRSQVVPHDVIEIEEDDDGVMVIGESAMNNKNKQAMEYDKVLQMQIKDALANDLIGSSTYHELGIAAALDPLKGSEPVSVDLNYTEDYEFDECEFEENDYDDYEYDSNIDYNFNLAAKFDDLDLPPGVEAAVPWLQKAAPEKPSKSKKNPVMDDEIEKKFQLFKQFDTVKEYSDHHFSKEGSVVKKDWAKRIQYEWKLLEKDLPETIFVRVYEERMDLLRAVIVGPAGTPYHDGLFFFDACFPSNYPQSPPLVHYYSFGLRLNPNLYNCGKVCLSLLGTWAGSGCEKWNSAKSTMLQVLVSIQALVLNAKPYFNEPGYANSAGTPTGEKKSLAYNEEAFLLSCKTMLYSLRRPPKYFEDYVAGHFRQQGRTILVACKAYMDGAQVGCVVGDGVQDVDEGDKSCSQAFKSSLNKLFEDLLMEFTVKGADCDEFLAQKVKAGASKAADTTLRL